MIRLPRCFTHIEWSRSDTEFIEYGHNRIAQPSATTLTLQGYFSVEEVGGCLIFKGQQGLGTSCLIDCTEDEMIMIQNFLTTIRG